MTKVFCDICESEVKKNADCQLQKKISLKVMQGEKEVTEDAYFNIGVRFLRQSFVGDTRGSTAELCAKCASDLLREFLEAYSNRK